MGPSRHQHLSRKPNLLALDADPSLCRPSLYRSFLDHPYLWSGFSPPTRSTCFPHPHPCSHQPLFWCGPSELYEPSHETRPSPTRSSTAWSHRSQSHKEKYRSHVDARCKGDRAKPHNDHRTKKRGVRPAVRTDFFPERAFPE